MLRLAGLALALLTVGVACTPEPCGRYVDYMCACHADEPDFDCDELHRVYGEADPELQDQCAIDLADQRDEDEEAGLECDVEDEPFFR